MGNQVRNEAGLPGRHHRSYGIAGSVNELVQTPVRAFLFSQLWTLAAGTMIGDSPVSSAFTASAPNIWTAISTAEKTKQMTESGTSPASGSFSS